MIKSLLTSLLIGFGYLSIGQQHELFFETSAGFQSLISKNRVRELVGSWATEIELSNPKTIYDFGVSHRNHFKRYFFSYRLNYNIEDFEYTERFNYTSNPNPNIPSTIEYSTEIRKRQITIQSCFGWKSKPNGRDYLYIETGPIIRFLVSPQANPLLEKHPIINGFGSSFSIGYSYMAKNQYRPTGPTLYAAITGIYSYENFNTDLDNFMCLLRVGIGHKW